MKLFRISCLLLLCSCGKFDNEKAIRDLIREKYPDDRLIEKAIDQNYGFRERYDLNQYDFDVSDWRYMKEGRNFKIYEVIPPKKDKEDEENDNG